jgi:decaprenylphospho-beta-D-ribofuranose 2-oxidase
MASGSSRKTIETLSPWALRPTIRGTVLHPLEVSEIAGMVGPVAGGLLPIGALRSYGDACVNPGGAHLSTNRLAKIVHFDADTGMLVCDSGVTLQSIIEHVLPSGWFLPVVPGTMLTTIGGAVACDVHGKNHHRQGSFSSSVFGFELVTANGELQDCSRSQNPELFWATIGGLGQTGIISRITVRLQQVESAYIYTRHIQTKNLAETLELCGTLEDHFSVCWIDSLGRGRQLGRGVLMVGHHATAQELADLNPKADPFSVPAHLQLKLPFFVPRFFTGSNTWRAFNAAYYALQGRHHGPRLADFRSYFFPLDGVAHWNRIYGRNGFIEYQFAIPLGGSETVCRQVLERLSASGNGSFLAVLKRFGPSSEGHLSFPIEGITLAVDMPAGGIQQAAILEDLDRIVANAGGRIYLVKDSRLTASFVDIMYPRRREWAEIVNRHDPYGMFTSSLVRRLGLRSV